MYEDKKQTRSGGDDSMTIKSLRETIDRVAEENRILRIELNKMRTVIADHETKISILTRDAQRNKSEISDLKNKLHVINRKSNW